MIKNILDWVKKPKRKMNRAKFYDYLRDNFLGRITQEQVDGIEALLDEGQNLPLHYMANILAQVYHETGGRMSPVRETFASSDQQAINRLERAWAKGQLSWVKTPYWRDGYFGRGQIQLTHKYNYDKFGIKNPSDALKPKVSARVAVKGMVEGLFTGKKLSDYNFPKDLYNSPRYNPRRIVNGRDGTDSKVARYHMHFANALATGGWK